MTANVTGGSVDPEPEPPPGDGDCVAGEETLCLQNGRFKVEVDWWTAGGEPSAAIVVPKGTDDSGLFRFFDPTNWEMLIKVLDGCGVNEHVWVYGASTTDLGYAIRVRDTVTNAVARYRNEAGEPARAITDNKAFSAACGEGSLAEALADGETGARLPEPHRNRAPLVSAASGSANCTPSGTSLCLADGRFEVTVDWSTADGRRGSGGAVPGTSNSGLFYFFGEDNWEMLVKVLDGCGVNEHHWVYAAAATDLGLDIAMTDTATGAASTYSKEPGAPAPAITANDAFAGSCRP